MNQTFQNSAQVISIGIFFTLLIIGLASTLPRDAERAAWKRTASPPRVAHHVGANAADLGPLRRLPRLQPDRTPGRRRSAARPAAARPRGADRPRASSRSLISGPFSDGLDTAFGFAIVACLVAAAASLLRGGRYHHAEEPRPGRRPRHHRSRNWRSSMRVEWHGQSAFTLDGEAATVFIDPFGDMSALARARACSGTTRRSRPTAVDLLLVTHEHGDHNAVEAIAGEPALLRSTAGTPRVAARRGGRRSPPSTTTAAGTERGPNTIFVFELDGLRVAHFGDFGQAALRPEQARGARRRSTCSSSRSAAARRSAARPRPRSPSELGAAWVVPMHYRTAADRLPRDRGGVRRGDAEGVERLDGAVLRDRRADAGDGPLAIVRGSLSVPARALSCGQPAPAAARALAWAASSRASSSGSSSGRAP